MVKEMKMVQYYIWDKNIKSNLCDYSGAYILVTRDITATGGDANANVAFKSCAQFTTCVSHINDEHTDTVKNIDITISMYNLIEYSSNYSETSGGLWKFKTDESHVTNAGNPDNVSTNNSLLFKYKSSILGKPDAVDGNGVLKNAKIVVLLKYLSNIWRSLEMHLVNCKINLELNWIKNCVMSVFVASTKFKITNTKLYVLIVTLSTEDNVKLTKQFNKGFKRSVYWNKYKTEKDSRER